MAAVDLDLNVVPAPRFHASWKMPADVGLVQFDLVLAVAPAADVPPVFVAALIAESDQETLPAPLIFRAFNVIV